VEKFGLDGPIAGQAEFDAGADRPAEVRVDLAEVAGFDTASSGGEPQRAVEQNIIEGDAAAATDRPEPGI
jgi:hypothetical protein